MLVPASSTIIDRITALEQRVEKMIAEGIAVMRAGVRQLKQDILQRMVELEPRVVMPRGPARGGRGH